MTWAALGFGLVVVGLLGSLAWAALASRNRELEAVKRAAASEARAVEADHDKADRESEIMAGASREAQLRASNRTLLDGMKELHAYLRRIGVPGAAQRFDDVMARLDELHPDKDRREAGDQVRPGSGGDVRVDDPGAAPVTEAGAVPKG